jgi:hypothetical protein
MGDETFTPNEAHSIGEEARHRLGLEPFRRRAVPDRHGRRARARDTGSGYDVAGNDPLLIGKVALAHLRELTDYTRLARMEAEGEAANSG